MRGAELPGGAVHPFRAVCPCPRLAVVVFGGVGTRGGVGRGVGVAPLAARRTGPRRPRRAGTRRRRLAHATVRVLPAARGDCATARPCGAEAGSAAVEWLDAGCCLADAQSSPRKRSVARRSAFVGRPAPRARTAMRSSLGG